MIIFHADRDLDMYENCNLIMLEANKNPYYRIPETLIPAKRQP